MAERACNIDILFFPKKDMVSRAFDVFIDNLLSEYDSGDSDTEEESEEADVLM